MDQSPAQALQRSMLDCAAQLAAGQAPRIDMRGLTAADAAALRQLCDTAAVFMRRKQGYQVALDALPQGFALFDRDLRLLHANRALRDFAVEFIDPQPGTSLAAFVEAVRRHGLISAKGAGFDAWVASIMAHPGVMQDVDGPGGRSYRWCTNTDASGNLILLVRETTSEMTRQRQLLEAHRRANDAAMAKSSFLTRMSHELRTPMNGIVGMVDLLCGSDLSPEQRRFADTIRTSAEALTTIISDVLDFAEDYHTTIKLFPRPFDLELLLIDVMTLLNPAAQARQIRMRLYFGATTPAHYVGDAGRVRQIVLNLMGNAIKYGAPGLVTLSVVRARGDLTILVTNDGAAIPDQFVDSIFDEFQRLGTGEAAPPGTGLGLAITEQLAQAMQGRLWVSSDAMRGDTCFGVTLPLPCDQPDQPAPLPDDKAPQILSLRREPGFGRRVGRILATSGYRLCHCNDMAETLLALDNGLRPSLVLLAETQRPEDLAAQARVLRARLPGVPVWAVVASGAVNRAVAGMDRTLIMPIARAEFVGAIADVVRGKGRNCGTQRRMRVLAADDNATNRLVLERMLATCDIDLLSVADGPAAAQAWRDWRPDLVFMDILMPGMDGTEVAELIRREETAATSRPVAIIALTAHTSQRQRVAILGSGCNDVLVKPLRRPVLLRLIARHAPADVRPPVTQMV